MFMLSLKKQCDDRDGLRAVYLLNGDGYTVLVGKISAAAASSSVYVVRCCHRCNSSRLPELDV